MKNTSNLKYYYWGHPIIKNCYNFGDLVTPHLMNHYCKAGTVAPATSIDDANIISTGSIIHHVRQDKKVVILGSGLLLDGVRKMPNAKVYSLRGQLTKERLGITQDIPLGDPALLLPRVFPMEKKNDANRPVGIVPHYVHFDDPALDKYRVDPRYRLINTRAEPRSVAQEMCACSYIISSSLHGLIVADAYGIPNIRLIMGIELCGGDYKFNDYYSAVGRTGKATRTITLDEISTDIECDTEYFKNIPAAQDGLEASFLKFANDIPLLNKWVEPVQAPEAAVSTVQKAAPVAHTNIVKAIHDASDRQIKFAILLHDIGHLRRKCWYYSLARCLSWGKRKQKYSAKRRACKQLLRELKQERNKIITSCM